MPAPSSAAAQADYIDRFLLSLVGREFAGKPLKYKLEDFHSTRPGHDPHYGLDPSKLMNLGWSLPVPFRESLHKTVKWTLEHPDWLLPD